MALLACPDRRSTWLGLLCYAILLCLFNLPIAYLAEESLARSGTIGHEFDSDVFKDLDLSILNPPESLKRKRVLDQEFDYPKSLKQKNVVGLETVDSHEPWSDSLVIDFAKSLDGILSNQSLMTSTDSQQPSSGSFGCPILEQVGLSNDLEVNQQPLPVEQAQVYQQASTLSAKEDKDEKEGTTLLGAGVDHPKRKCKMYNFLERVKRGLNKYRGDQGRDVHEGFNNKFKTQAEALGVLYTGVRGLCKLSIVQTLEHTSNNLPFYLLTQEVPPYRSWIRLPSGHESKQGKVHKLQRIQSRIVIFGNYLDEIHTFFYLNGLDEYILGKTKNTHQAVFDWFYDLIFKETEHYYPLLGPIQSKNAQKTFSYPQIIIHKIINDDNHPTQVSTTESVLNLLKHFYQFHPSKLPNCPLSTEEDFVKLIDKALKLNKKKRVAPWMY